MGERIESHDGDYLAHAWLDRLGLHAHALVHPSGEIERMRDDSKIAYHARGHNSTSLGVEVLVPGVHTYATFAAAIAEPGWVGDRQLDALVKLVRHWRDTHGIRQIVRHSDISPGRKIDPGAGFPWAELIARVTS